MSDFEHAAPPVRRWPTIGSRLEERKGVSRGIDYLRIILAIAVVLWHSLETSYSDGTSVRVWHAFRGVISFILPGFFALSGFLVCGSLVRTKSIWIFLLHRVIRLIPALLVEVLLSALILGPIFTHVALKAYVLAPESRLYFLNVVGLIHYHLPGVFLQNPNPGIVNKSLWTIPYELECYLSLVFVSLLTLVRRKGVFLALVVLASVGLAAYVDLTHAAILNSVGPPGRLLVLSFLAGICLYLWRDKVPLSPILFVVCLALSVLSLCFAQTMFLSAFPVAYVIAWLGMRNPRHIPVLMDGDYSYGLYLFAYPLQQTYAAVFSHERHWWLNVAFTLVTGFAYAFFSWNVIEKNVLGRRKQIVLFVEGVFHLPLRYAAARLQWRSLRRSE